jgi:hypothetical protein
VTVSAGLVAAAAVGACNAVIGSLSDRPRDAGVADIAALREAGTATADTASGDGCPGRSCSEKTFDAEPDAASDTGKTDVDSDAKADAAEPDTSSDAKSVCGGTNGPCACTKTSDCSSDQECVAGACQASSTVCEYSSQCGSSDVCVNGQCLAACGEGTPCTTGFTCTNGACEPAPAQNTCTSNANCPSTAPDCISGGCAPACTQDAECPTGDYCDQGACVLDTRTRPDCTEGGGQCLANQVCQGGFCLYTCSTDSECMEIDSRIPDCSNNVCRSTAEANPQCTSQSDCETGQSCVGNVCE